MKTNTINKVMLFGLVTSTLAAIFAPSVRAQETVVGTYTINYRSNCAGIYTDQSHPNPTNANPYFNTSIPPGPVFLSVPPGTYRLEIVSGGGCSIWSGDSSNGTWSVTGHSPGESVTVNHLFGQIALYYWDWVPGDNDPTISTTVAVYSVQQFGTPVGSYTLNYRDNCAGLYTDQSNPAYTNANPYFGNVLPPGPIFIDATPGRYKVVVAAGAGCSTWSGDASGGGYLSTGHSPGEVVTIDHAFGQLALYYWDWVPGDNDPNIHTTLYVYRTSSFGLSLQRYAGITLTGKIGATYDLEYSTNLATGIWSPLTEVALTNSPYLFIDTNSPASANRFYRSVLKR